MGNCELIIKCSVSCEVYIDGHHLCRLLEETVEKTIIESGQHLLEFKRGTIQDLISTHIITAPNSGRIVVYDEKLKALIQDEDDKWHEDIVATCQEAIKEAGEKYREWLREKYGDDDF